MLYQHYTTSELKSSEKLAYLIKKEDRILHIIMSQFLQHMGIKYF